MEKINSIDLFAGCGGLMDGFESEGSFRTIACVEWEKAPCETLRKRLSVKWNHANSKQEVIQFDIQRTDELINGYSDKEYGDHVGLDRIVNDRQIQVVIGGPPCQAYSLAGRIRDANGMKDDYRNYLFESYIRVVSHYKPDFFIFENVQGMLSAAPDGVLIVDKIKEGFKNIGYKIADNFNKVVFDLSEFGVPQHRKRVIILGVSEVKYKDKSEEILNAFYSEIMPSFKCEKVTVREAVEDLPKLFPLDSIVKEGAKKYSHSPVKTEVSNHVPRFHSQRDIEIFRLLSNDIQSGVNQYRSISALKELYSKVTGKDSNVHKYFVLPWDDQSNTIPAHLYKDGLRHIHPDPEQARSITVREAARLQAFDNDFEFLGSMMAQYKMIGNAVPPKFSLALAKSLHKIINEYN